MTHDLKMTDLHHENEISICWHVDDVLSIRPDLSDAQARDVLHNAKHNHDASIGICWDVLSTIAGLLYPE